MNPFNIVIYGSLFCAIAMILGGIWLLAKGAIKLSEEGKNPGGLTVEVFNKIKVNTGYPALAFFIIALFFIALAMWFSKPADVLSLNIDGKLNIDGDPSELVTIKVVPSSESGVTLHPNSDGSLTRTLHPEFALDVVINAAGYEPERWKETISMTKGVLQSIPLPAEIKFTKSPIAPPDGGKIIALPEDVKAPPVQEAKGFKPSS
jgi:hypothetical protein